MNKNKWHVEILHEIVNPTLFSQFGKYQPYNFSNDKAMVDGLRELLFQELEAKEQILYMDEDEIGFVKLIEN